MPYKFKLMVGGERKLDEHGKFCTCEGCGAILEAHPDEREGNWKKRRNCNGSCAMKARHRQWREGVDGVARPGRTRGEPVKLEDWMFEPDILPAHINAELYHLRMMRGSLVMTRLG